jgi:hypothetical protein
MSGYAYAQLERLQKHRSYLLSPIETKPTREEFGLKEKYVCDKNQLEAVQAMIRKKLDDWSWKELDDVSPPNRQAIQDEFNKRLLEITKWSFNEIEDKLWFIAVKELNIETNFIELLDKERRYANKLKDFEDYQNWKKNRNPIRAALEAKMGYDGKFALHLIRLFRQCKDLLINRTFCVRRDDAKELLEIRNGFLTYEQLLEKAEKERNAIGELVKITKLPKAPDYKAIDKLCIDVISEFLNESAIAEVKSIKWSKNRTHWGS